MDTTTFDRRLAEIKGMSFADLDQLLSTLPPLRCAADMHSPIADAIVQQGLAGDPSKNVCPEWEYPDEVYKWDTITGGGVYQVRGFAPIKLVTERLCDIVLANKIVVVIGEDEGFMELVGDPHG